MLGNKNKCLCEKMVVFVTMMIVELVLYVDARTFMMHVIEYLCF